ASRLSTPAIARTYVGVGVTAKGRRGPLSMRVAVPMGPPPPAPMATSAAYDERRITVVWQGVGPQESVAIAYHVYEVSPRSAPGASDPNRTPLQTVARETRLTTTPVAETRYLDTRMTWGATRCYVVRAVLSLESLAVEGD